MDTDFDGEYYTNKEELCFQVVEQSEWRCQLFGLGEGLVLHPSEEGIIPNRFWRVMQYLFFGCKWIKEEK